LTEGKILLAGFVDDDFTFFSPRSVAVAVAAQARRR
jgi:hypothetical protein